jgi:hypothetical protein
LPEYKNFTNSFLIIKGIQTLGKETFAIFQVVTALHNDLIINKFANIFSLNFLNYLDEIKFFPSIHKKFSYFENCVNKIKNIFLEIEADGKSIAILLTKFELKEALKNIVTQFIIYDINLNINEMTKFNSEKLGFFYTQLNKNIITEILKTSLKETNRNFEKISNVILALTWNKLVYEMDQLNRQLNILKENLFAMEDCIKS